MYTAILAFAGAASAAAIMPRAASDKCCFNINVSGGVSSGSLGQFTDGQNRVGPGYGGAQYCYYGASGSIVDASGRGCVISGPTSQFQCDAGVTASTAANGFTIAANNSIEHNGNAVFWECYSTAAQGVYNIYTSNPGSQALDCQPIVLTTVNSDCAAASASASTSGVASTISVATSPVASVSTATVGLSTNSVRTSTVATTLTTTAKASTSTAVVSSNTSPQASTSIATVPVVVSSTITPIPASSSAPAPSSATIPVSAPPVVSVSSCVPVTVTLPASTVTVTIVPSCSACPVVPTATVVVPTATIVVPTTSAPVVSVPATTYACNPAHSYPNGVSCISTAGTLSLVSSVPAQSTTVVSVPVVSTISNTVPAQSTTVVTVPVVSTVSNTVPAASNTAPVTSTASSCPKGLVGQQFEYPHLIVPVNKNSPNTVYGNQYFASVNGSFSTIFNFDIPASYASKTCSLEFLLPNKKDLTTSDYTFSGTGAIDFQQLATPATHSTSYANQPKVSKDLGVFTITAGSSTIIASGACAAGQTVSYELVAQDSTALYYFQDYNPAALGLYIVSC